MLASDATAINRVVGALRGLQQIAKTKNERNGVMTDEHFVHLVMSHFEDGGRLDQALQILEMMLEEDKDDAD